MKLFLKIIIQIRFEISRPSPISNAVTTIAFDELSIYELKSPISNTNEIIKTTTPVTTITTIITSPQTLISSTKSETFKTEEETESTIVSTKVSLVSSSSSEEISTDLLTTTRETTSISFDEDLIFTCGFDTNLNFESQCGGIETKIEPLSSLADISLLKNELVSGSSPSFSLTDVKSICNYYFSKLYLDIKFCQFN